MTRKLWPWSLLSLLLLAAPSVASQPNVPPALQRKSRYLGAHPITNVVNGYCQIDVPHTHGYSPDKPALYQRVGEDYVFTGDPVPFGYDGQKTVFYGHHPVPVHVEALPGSVPPPPTFCFLKGPHFHEYPVAHEAPGYKVQNDVVFYVGPIPPEVARARPQVEKAIEVEYRPYVAQRPKVIVTPPPEWQGTVWVEPPPQVVVAPSNPTVVVAPSNPAVVVAPSNPTVVVAAPAPAVVVAPPAPVFIGVPGAVIMHGHGHGHGHGKGHFFHPGRGKGHWKRW